VSKDKSLRVPSQLDALIKEHQQILQFVKNHDELTYEQIAEQVGASKSTVIRIVKAASISRRRGRKLHLQISPNEKTDLAS
jgi:DNA-binding MurR/RpiR family transcriptional regulator